jgi:hypothetical protein
MIFKTTLIVAGGDATVVDDGDTRQASQALTYAS